MFKGARPPMFKEKRLRRQASVALGIRLLRKANDKSMSKGIAQASFRGGNLARLGACWLAMCRVGQNRTCTPYMTVYLVISLPKIPYIHRIYIWFWPTLAMCCRDVMGKICVGRGLDEKMCTNNGRFNPPKEGGCCHSTVVELSSHCVRKGSLCKHL
jgi:hypothetical protein